MIVGECLNMQLIGTKNPIHTRNILMRKRLCLRNPKSVET